MNTHAPSSCVSIVNMYDMDIIQVRLESGSYAAADDDRSLYEHILCTESGKGDVFTC